MRTKIIHSCSRIPKCERGHKFSCLREDLIPFSQSSRYKEFSIFHLSNVERIQLLPNQKRVKSLQAQSVRMDPSFYPIAPLHSLVLALAQQRGRSVSISEYRREIIRSIFRKLDPWDSEYANREGPLPKDHQTQ